MKVIREFLETLGRLSYARKSKKDTSSRGGQWINNGTDIDEDWVWEDPNILLRPIYLNIYREGDSIVMAKGHIPRLGSLENIECDSVRELELMVKFLSREYKKKGNIVIDIDD